MALLEGCAMGSGISRTREPKAAQTKLLHSPAWGNSQLARLSRIVSRELIKCLCRALVDYLLNPGRRAARVGKWRPRQSLRTSSLRFCMNFIEDIHKTPFFLRYTKITASRFEPAETCEDLFPEDTTPFSGFSMGTAYRRALAGGGKNGSVSP